MESVASGSGVASDRVIDRLWESLGMGAAEQASGRPATDRPLSASAERGVLESALTVDVSKVRPHLDEVVRSTVEETLNGLAGNAFRIGVYSDWCTPWQRAGIAGIVALAVNTNDSPTDHKQLL